MVKKILDAFAEKKIQDDRYNTEMLKYIEGSKEFTNLSINDYAFLENLYWDSVMLKKYISGSDILIKLDEIGIVCRTFSDVKNQILNYAANYNVDITTLKKAILLYESIDEIAEIKNNNIVMMAHNLGEIVGMDIMSKDDDGCLMDLPFLVGDKSTEEYSNNREVALKKLEQFYIFDKILDATTYGYAVEMVNQVFDYYISGIDAYSINVDEIVKKKKRD